MKRRSHLWFLRLLGLALLFVALWGLWQGLRGVRPAEVIHQIRLIPNSALGRAVALTVASYALVLAYDFLPLRFLSHRIGFWRTAKLSFVAHVVSNLSGAGGSLAGHGVRYRFFSRWRIRGADWARVVAFQTSMRWIGFLGISGVMLLILTLDEWSSLALVLARLSWGADAWVRSVAFWSGFVAVLLLVGLGWLAAHRGVDPVRGRILSLSLVVAMADWTLTAGVPFVLLGSLAPIGFSSYFGVFLVARLAGVLSQVPGGVGVFEGVFFALLGSQLSADRILGVLLVYRILYYLIPTIPALFAYLSLEKECRLSG